MQNKSTIQNLVTGVFKKLKKTVANPYQPIGISWLDLRKLKNQPAGKLYTQKFLNGYIEFYNSIELLYGLKDIFIHEIYKIDLINNARIIDCGGHIGLSAIYLKSQHPTANITVFEPDEKNFQLLKRNILSQGYHDIELKQAAIWTENTTLNFRSEGSMSSKVVKSDEPEAGLVKAVRLKEFLTTETDLLKLDIEGAEFNVLKDIKDDFHLLKNIFIEYHGNFSQQNELMQILNWIEEAGFKFYIKEAHNVYPHPFYRNIKNQSDYEVQLNIFCFRI